MITFRKLFFIVLITSVTATTEFNCTFDEDLCGWTQAQDDDFDWERHSGQSSATNSGPANDHTQGNAGGYYMYINSKDYRLNQKARLVSPVVTMTGGQQKCFHFYYLMHGAEVGTLDVYTRSTDGTMSSSVWSRTGTQGIFYLLGKVTINTTSMVIVEGSGSSGNQGDIAIDDVSLVDGACTSVGASNSASSLACDFELGDICGYTNDQGNDMNWRRNVGFGTAGISLDHTTRTAGGAFMAISGYLNQRGSLRSIQVTAQGTYCVSFFYREHGAFAGMLYVSVLDISNNTVSTANQWMSEANMPLDQWNKAQLSLNISSVVQLSFDAIVSGEAGSLSFDDISIRNGTCETPPDCSFDKYDLCSWRNDLTHDEFDWEVATSDSDAQILAPWRDADNNEHGGFILLDMARNPNKEEAYLVSEVIPPQDIQCFSFYYYPLTWGSEFEDTAMHLHIYVSTGANFPGVLSWSYTMTKHATAFALGELPLQMQHSYRLVIGGLVTLGQVLALDKFSLLSNNCSFSPAEAKPPAQAVTSAGTTTATTKQTSTSNSTGPHSLWDCDFETDSCHWSFETTADSAWSRQQAGLNQSGPQFDHTKGPGGHGYYLKLDRGGGEMHTEYSLQNHTNYCFIFWIYLYGSANFEFRVQTVDTYAVVLFYKHNSMGTDWHQTVLDLPPYAASFDIQFIYEQTSAGNDNQLAIDDIQVSEGKCSLEVGPNCTFDRGLCNWKNVEDSSFNVIWGNLKGSSFNFTPSSGAETDDGGIENDHTTETDLGSFMKATIDSHEQGQKAQFQSPQLKFKNSVCMRFYYFVTPSCDSALSVETLGPQDSLPVLLLDLQDIVYGAWQSTEVTVYDPLDIQVIFVVTVGLNRSGEVGLDDVMFIDGECPYRGTTDFESGFYIFHNVHSNDFNWVIASPSDGIFTWLPETDFSSNSRTGHFAVVAFNFSHSAGSKAELWGQLSPQMTAYCTTFSFYVHGRDPGMMNVTFVDYLEQSRVVVWSYTPTSASKDSRIDAQFPHVFASKFYVVFTVILGSEGGWALDSIETFPTPSVTCRVLPAQAAASTVATPTNPAPQTTTDSFFHQKFAECNFAINLCNWYIPNYSDFNWTRTSGDTDLPFVPSQSRPGGDPYFLTLPKFTPWKDAILQSPSFNEQAPGSELKGQFDFRMWLNMQGEHTGRFEVSLNSDVLSDTIYYRDTATNSWEQIEFSVDVAGPFTLTMQGERGTYDSDAVSIDDIEVSNTAAIDGNTVYKCTFESSDLCGFKQDDASALHWWYRGGEDDSILQDHTTMTEAGHVAAVSQSEGKPGYIARMVSPTVPPMSGCLSFWLLMASDGYALRVYISSGSQEELILQNQNIQGYVWLKREAPVSSNLPLTIILEAEVLAARTADLIIDDFQLSNSICDTKGACTFERDLCTWQNSLISGADFDWIRGTGKSVGVTGPAVDSTIGSSDGHYMYIDSSGPYHYQDKAWLDSASFPQGKQCLHFHYYMSGFSVGTLSVYTLPLDSVDAFIVWSLSGDQGSAWKSALVTVGNSLVNYNVRFEGTLGFSVTSDIAIDDVMFMPDACDIQPLAAKVIDTVPTPTTSASNQSSQVILEQCDFNDVHICGFQNGISDNVWVLAGPDMPVSSTLKPFNGHTSNGSNGFIYAQVGSGLKENATAQIISPEYTRNIGEEKCLEFYYHMNGDQVGQLNVYIAPDGQQDSLTNSMRLWSQNFDAGPDWKKGRVPIRVSTNYHHALVEVTDTGPSFTDVSPFPDVLHNNTAHLHDMAMVIFEAIRSKVDYYYGIDDLTVYDNPCEPTDSCDFEDDLCLWSNKGGDPDAKIYWTRYRSYDRTAMFAPAVDHTRQSVTGYYMFLEASLENAGSVARLYSQVFESSSSSYCFNFWYYMFGNDLGQLKVFVRSSISSNSVYNEADLWELDGPTDDGWNLAQVNISRDYTKKPFMVIIEATVGSTLQGAFGVDDTQFDFSDCGTSPSAAIVTADDFMLPDCNFDDGTMCDWTTTGNNWKYTFVVTESGGAIPFDHTGGSGQFLFADSKTYSQNTSVSIQSPLLPPTFGASCLTLWYNMDVAGMSSLTLTMITGANDVLLWQAYPEKNSEWSPLRINLQNDFDYKLMVAVVIGTADAGSVAVDDISLIHGACPRSEIIDFEEDLSGFTPVTSSNIRWTRKIANDSFAHFDHTYHTSQGHLIQADLGSTATTLKTAAVRSPLYPSVGDECMEFWYAKKGSNGGWLSVQISQSGPGQVAEESNPKWMTTADTSGMWTRVLLDISTNYPYWIIFQAAANNSQVSDVLAIDDISFTTEACPSVVSCDFDVNNCGYVSRSNTSVYWQVTKGAYTDSFMPVDQTLHSAQGMYMEADFPESLGTFTVDLISPMERQSSNKCLIFWYYAMGQGILQVFTQIRPDQRQSLTILTFSTSTNEESWWFRSWKRTQVDVNSSAPYSIVFEATSQNPVTSIVIDSISLLNGTCADQTNNPTTNTQASTELDPKKAMLGCDFENSDFCNFTNGSSRTLHWKLFSFNSKHSAGTGLDFDHTKYNKYGHHAYMDASGQKFNTTAQLVSPSFITDQHMCLSFYYAMYGRDVNQLNVFVAQGQTHKLYWTLSGNQGEDWHHQTVEIGESPQPTQVIFQGVVGVSAEGDIDLDDIWIFHGNCPPPDYCDFEDSEMCKMDQDNMDDAYWMIQSAALASGSDPKTDHTYGTNQGHYLMLNMSTTESGNQGRILTRQYSADSARCLSFWFHFSNPPDKSHSLTVTLQDERGVGKTLMVLRGFFQDDWTPAVFPLQLADNFQVVFDGQSSGSEGSIAVDDIRVSPNECESYIDCDFESQDMCGWKAVPEYSIPAWEVIPPHHYMTLNFSKIPTKTFQVSKVQSLIIPPGLGDSFCLTFDYMMYGDNVGYLNVSMEVEYPEEQSIVIFSTYGDQGSDTWKPAHGDSPQTDAQISHFVITGTTVTTSSNTITAIILISDVSLFPRPCSQWLEQENGTFTCNAQVTIPLSSVCDFMPDCPGNADELNCGSCDFESGYCKWEDDTDDEAQSFSVVSSIPIVVFTDVHPGMFLTLERRYTTATGNADLVLNQEIGPSPNNCSLIFSYYMSLDSQSMYGNLFVSVEENYEETVVWESAPVNSTNWQTASVDIGGIHSRFKIHLELKYLPFDNAVGLDDIELSGCSFADIYSGSCPGLLKCQRTGACIDDANKFCDFTDDCGDDTDENPDFCRDYLMDDFEESFGDWSQDDKDDFDWSRHSGSWVSSSSGPRRDHTLGTHFGHYLIFEGGTHAEGQIARLVSPEFVPTQNGDCKIRFYYHMHGSNKGQLTLYIRLKTSGRMQQIDQYFTTLKDSWLYGSSVLTSNDSFQVVFEGKVVGQHSTDTGLDDVTFTPGCQLRNPSTNRPGTTKLATTAKSSGATTTPGIITTHGATTKPGIITNHGATTKPGIITTHGATTKPGIITNHGATTKPGIITTHGATTKPGIITNHGATTKPGITTNHGATTKPGITTNHGATTKPGITTNHSVTFRPHATSEQISTVTLPAEAGDAAESTSSDSWRVPVGVVLGLAGLVTVIAGVVIYLKRTRRLRWLTFPLLKKNTETADVNPLCELDFHS